MSDKKTKKETKKDTKKKSSPKSPENTGWFIFNEPYPTKNQRK